MLDSNIPKQYTFDEVIAGAGDQQAAYQGGQIHGSAGACSSDNPAAQWLLLQQCLWLSRSIWMRVQR